MDWNFRASKQNRVGVCYKPPNQNTGERSFFLDSLYSTFDKLLDAIKKPFVTRHNKMSRKSRSAVKRVWMFYFIVHY